MSTFLGLVASLLVPDVLDRVLHLGRRITGQAIPVPCAKFVVRPLATLRAPISGAVSHYLLMLDLRNKKHQSTHICEQSFDQAHRHQAVRRFQ